MLIAFTLAHVALALRFPLASDESYYWEWSRRLDWGYYDQAPMIAWLIRASTALFGSSEFGVRAGVILCSSAMLWLTYLLGRRLFSERTGVAAMLLAGITPMGLAGGFIATYDVPLALFWTASLYALARATEPESAQLGSPEANALRGWLMLGIASGLGMMSKYTMALFLPCALLFLGGRPDLRKWLRRPEPYLALMAALAVAMPNIVWLARHEWASFGHLAGLTAARSGSTPLKRLGDFVGSQAGLMTPILFIGMAVAAVAGCRARSGAKGYGAWLAFCFGAPVVAFFIVLSLKAKVQANWAICGWIALSVGYAGWVWGEDGNRRRAMFAWSGIALAAFVSIMAGWPELRRTVGLRVPAKLDQSRKMYGGRELGAAIAAQVRSMADAGARPLIGAVTYDVASRMAFYAPGQPRAVCLFLGTRPNQYRYLNQASGTRLGSNVLIADHRPPDDPELAPFEAFFDRVEPVPEPVVVRVPAIYDEPVVEYYLYRCYGLKDTRVLDYGL